MLGRLNISAISYDNLIIMGAFGGMIVVFLIILFLITYLRKWPYIWKEWLTSVDHKKIGAMYVMVAIIMGIRAYVDSLMMRTQLAASYGTDHGYLAAEHFDQIFTGHGVIMIFLMAMPFVIGLMNIAMPLQIGSRDVAFPRMNLISLWLLIAGAVLMNISLGIGEFAKTGWIAYPPLSELEFSPYVGVDYYIWILQITGIGTLLTGINFVVTILKMRAPGMKLMQMPLFSWATLVTSILIIGAFPILTVNIALLGLDRYLDMHFFTNDGGGNMMLYVNWFWTWGHPEVYILVLPVFGVFSEIIANFSRKQIFGYNSMVYSMLAITIIAYVVWAHHFFVMGAGGTVNAIFSIMTMIIAVPTGVKIFNWIFTMYRGRIQFDTPMLWTLGFLVTFVIGGMTGVMLALPPADFVLHNSEFVVAHFHNVIISGTVFGALAGYTYWFPKVFGFQLNERIGKIAFGFFVGGLCLTFAPLYILGFMGMTRRINHYDNPSWMLPMDIAVIGVFVIAISLFLLILQLVMSFIRQHELRDWTGDPWKGRTLEWSVASPAPHYNFAVIPKITTVDQFWADKKQGIAYQPPEAYEDILIPKNTPVGFFIGMLSIVFGFGMVWHIWWMALIGILALIGTLIWWLSNDDLYYYLPAEEVKSHREEHILLVNEDAALSCPRSKQ